MSPSSSALSRALIVSLLALLMLVVAAPARAHVTLRTDNPTAGRFAVYTIRVPNERDDAATTSMEVQMPEGFEASRYEPVDGWDITLEDGLLTVSGGTIEPGQYRDFSFQARNPEEPGVLRFPAIQTYDSGEVVEWTGSEDSDTPAATVELVAGAGEGGHDGGGDGATQESTADAATGEDSSAALADAGEDADGGAAAASTTSVTWVALGLSVVALVLGGLAVARSRTS